jgi:hypothetical protein
MTRTATTVELSGAGDGAGNDVVDLVVEAEKLGLDVCFVAEAWGSYAPSALGYLAARNHRMLLGSGVLQVGTRTPHLGGPNDDHAVQPVEWAIPAGPGRLRSSGDRRPARSQVQPAAGPDRRKLSTSLRQVFAGAKISYSGN